MSESDDYRIRRDADGVPIVTGVSFTRGGFWNDEMEAALIQRELAEEE